MAGTISIPVNHVVSMQVELPPFRPVQVCGMVSGVL